MLRALHPSGSFLGFSSRHTLLCFHSDFYASESHICLYTSLIRFTQLDFQSEKQLLFLPIETLGFPVYRGKSH